MLKKERRSVKKCVACKKIFNCINCHDSKGCEAIKSSYFCLCPECTNKLNRKFGDS